jgi:hypothetical protein
MSYLITKATIEMTNGDKLIIKDKISTPNVEIIRRELRDMHSWKSILFVYVEETDLPTTEVQATENN